VPKPAKAAASQRLRLTELGHFARAKERSRARANSANGSEFLRFNAKELGLARGLAIPVSMCRFAFDFANAGCGLKIAKCTAHLCQTICSGARLWLKWPTLWLRIGASALLAEKWRGWFRFASLRKSGQDLCIDRVGLGQDAAARAYLPHPNGLHQGDARLFCSKLSSNACSCRHWLHRSTALGGGTLF